MFSQEKKAVDQEKPSVPINMVSILPAEFKAYEDDEKVEEAMTHLTLQPHQNVFEKSEKHQNFKPLYNKGYVDEKPMTKMLVDGGATINLMPYTTYRKLGKWSEDLNKTGMMLKDFGGNMS